MSGFGGGRTSQQTIVKLAKCNAVISYVIEALYEVDINHVNVSTLRKAVFGKSREKGLDSKTFCVNNLKKLLIYLNLSCIILEKIMIKGIMIC